MKVVVIAVISLLVMSCVDKVPNDPDADIVNANADADTKPAILHTLEVSIQGDGSGSVSVDGTPCTEFPCAIEIEEGQTVVIVASANLDSSFLRWSNLCGAAPSCEVLMEQDQILVATFGVAGELQSQRGFELVKPAFASDVAGNLYSIDVRRVGTGPTFAGDIIRLDKYSGNDRLWRTEFPVDDPYLALGEARHIFLGPQGHVYAIQRTTRIFPSDGLTLELVKLDGQTGQLVWTVQIQGADLLRAYDLSVDSNGTVIVAGSFSGTARIGTATLQSDSLSAFVVRFTDTGGYLGSTLRADTRARSTIQPTRWFLDCLRP